VKKLLYLQRRRSEKDVGGLCDVSSMEMVMVWNILPAGGESAPHVSVKKIIAKVVERSAARSWPSFPASSCRKFGQFSKSLAIFWKNPFLPLLYSIFS